MIIGIQGQRYSYHDQAAQQYWDNKLSSIKHATTFEEVFTWLVAGKVEAVVCAVENTIYGGINDVYDLLIRHEDVWIGGELRLPIGHCLAGMKDAALPDITDVYSHPVALGQCKTFLSTHIPHATTHEWHDTAAAAKLVAQKQDPSKAVICSELAAEAYNLHILQQNIADNTSNTTRFLVLFPQSQPAKDANKTSLVLDIAHKPGALYDTLGTFKTAALNLSMIASRPIPEHPWQYRFLLDVDAGIHEPHFKLAVEALKRQNIHLRILGSYRAATQ